MTSITMHIMNITIEILFMPCIILKLKFRLCSFENMVRISRYESSFERMDFMTKINDMKLVKFVIIIALTLRIPQK